MSHLAATLTVDSAKEARYNISPTPEIGEANRLKQQGEVEKNAERSERASNPLHLPYAICYNLWRNETARLARQVAGEGVRSLSRSIA